jgi:hypothetical protein
MDGGERIADLADTANIGNETASQDGRACRAVALTKADPAAENHRVLIVQFPAIAAFSALGCRRCRRCRR